MHGLDTSNVSSRVESRRVESSRVEPSGIWPIASLKDIAIIDQSAEHIVVFVNVRVTFPNQCSCKATIIDNQSYRAAVERKFVESYRIWGGAFMTKSSFR